MPEGDGSSDLFRASPVSLAMAFSSLKFLNDDLDASIGERQPLNLRPCEHALKPEKRKAKIIIREIRL